MEETRGRGHGYSQILKVEEWAIRLGQVKS
jgi:hypothetical protein